MNSIVSAFPNARRYCKISRKPANELSPIFFLCRPRQFRERSPSRFLAIWTFPPLPNCPPAEKKLLRKLSRELIVPKRINLFANKSKKAVKPLSFVRELTPEKSKKANCLPKRKKRRWN